MMDIPELSSTQLILMAVVIWMSTAFPFLLCPAGNAVIPDILAINREPSLLKQAKMIFPGALVELFWPTSVPVLLQLIGSLFALWITGVYLTTPFLQHLLKEFLTIVRGALFAYKYERSLGFIITKDDITAEWLENTINTRGSFSKPVKIRNIRLSPVGDDSGNASVIYRIHIDFHDLNECSECPRTMMLKLPKDSVSNKLIFSATRMYEMEVSFYAYIQDYFPLLSPKHYASAYCKHGGGLFYILMQDLDTLKEGKCEFIREQDSCGLGHAVAVVSGLARFHSTFWNSPPDFIMPQNEPRLSLSGVAMKFSWRKFVSRLKGRLPTDILKRGLLLHSIASKIQERQSNGPITIVHGDCHLENMFFVKCTNEDNFDEYKLGLYDWQLMRRGRGMLDLANFISGSITMDADTSGLEAYLVGIYVDALKDLGIRGYTHEEAWLDYRLSVVMLFIWNVSAAVAVPFDTSGSHDYDHYVLRICKTMVRHGLIDVALAYADEVESGSGLPVTLSFPGEAAHTIIEPRIDLHQTNHTKPLDRQSLTGKLKYNVAYALTSSKHGHHGAKSESRSDLALESCHDVDWARNTNGEKYVFDSYYLSSFAHSKDSMNAWADANSEEENSGVSFAIRLCRRSVRSNGEAWVFVKVPGLGVLISPAHPTTLANVEEIEDGKGVYVEGDERLPFKVRLELKEAMNMWYVQLEGTLKHRDSDDEYDVQLDGVWRATGGMFAFGQDIAPSLTAEGLSREPWSRNFFKELQASHQEHYEQFGVTDGFLKLRPQSKGCGWRTIPIHACGMRDRAWGIRDWAYLSRYCTMYLWARDTQSGELWHFNISLVALPTMTHLRTGSVERVGIDVKPRSIKACSGSLPLLGADGTPPQRFQFGFATNDGLRYHLHSSVDTGNTIGLDMGPGRFFVNFRFTNFNIYVLDLQTSQIRTLQGCGGSEFGYRRKGVAPYRPLELHNGVNPTAR